MDALVLLLSCVVVAREVLDALEMESRSLWNLRLVVASATGMLSRDVSGFW